MPPTGKSNKGTNATSALPPQAQAAVEAFKAAGEAIKNIITGTAKLSTAGAAILKLPFDVLANSIASINTHITTFIGKLNPAYLNRWNRAIDDLQAAIGHVLLPVLEHFIGMARQIGAVIYGLNDDGRAAVQGITGGIVVLKTLAAVSGALATILTGGLLPVITALVGGVAGLAETSKPVQAIFEHITLIIGGMVEKIGAAIKKLEPAVIPLFRIAGKLIEFAVRIANTLTDIFADLAPDFEAVASAIENTFDVLIETLKPLFEVFANFMKVELKGFLVIAESAISIFGQLATAFLAVAHAANELFKLLFSFLGINYTGLAAAGESKPKSAVGLAARSTSTTEPTDVLRRAREAAFALGGGVGKSDIPRMVAEISTKLGKLDIIAIAIETLKTNIIEWINNPIVKLGEAVREAAREAAPVVGGGLRYGGLGIFGAAAAMALDYSRERHE